MEGYKTDGVAHSPPHPSMNASSSRDRLWRKRLNELNAVWPDFVSGRPSGLHKTRVASRRIREALPIVGVATPAKAKKLSKKMRALTRYLGPIRELDVELDILEDRSKADGVPLRAIEMVRREVASRRQALRQELTDNVPVGDIRKLLKKLERVAEKGARGKGEGTRGKGRGARGEGISEGEWRGVLAARLMRRAKALAAALDEAGPLYAPERIHEVRIATKKLRYAVEIAQDAGIPAAALSVRMLKRHQARLGRLHDLQMLLKHVRETEASPGITSRVNDLTAYADSLDRECRRLHADFVEHRGELASVARDVRHHIVPALTTVPRKQAHVSATHRPPLGTAVNAPKAKRPAARQRVRVK